MLTCLESLDALSGDPPLLVVEFVGAREVAALHPGPHSRGTLSEELGEITDVQVDQTSSCRAGVLKHRV